MNVICVISVVYIRGGKRAHERNLRNKRCLHSGGSVRMNVICVISVVYIRGESVCMRCDTLQNGGRRNSREKNG